MSRDRKVCLRLDPETEAAVLLWEDHMLAGGVRMSMTERLNILIREGVRAYFMALERAADPGIEEPNEDVPDMEEVAP